MILDNRLKAMAIFLWWTLVKRVVQMIPIVPIDTASSTKGETSLYAARIGLDGFHAVSPSGALPIRQWLPKFEEAGAVKKGEVEMLATAALKATKAAGIMRKIKVQ